MAADEAHASAIKTERDILQIQFLWKRANRGGRFPKKIPARQVRKTVVGMPNIFRAAKASRMPPSHDSFRQGCPSRLISRKDAKIAKPQRRVKCFGRAFVSLRSLRLYVKGF